jgi:PPM family protein phosphatase
MLNIPYKITTELPLQTASTSSYGARVQISQNNSNKRFCISSISDKGKFKEENQDSLLIKYSETALGHCVMLVVADGVGGLKGGEIASKSVVEKLNDWWNMILTSIKFKNFKSAIQVVHESLHLAISDINFEVFEKGNIGGYKMGTTLSLLFILDNWYCIKHVGDSRVYKLSGNMEQLTEDHTLLNRYIISGTKNEPTIDYEAMANTITKCIGVKPDIELFELSGELNEGDSFMLCTDGLYKHTSFREIYKCIHKCDKGDVKSQEVLQQMILRARSRGEFDDISSIVLIHSKNSRGLLKNLIIFIRKTFSSL